MARKYTLQMTSIPNEEKSVMQYDVIEGSAEKVLDSLLGVMHIPLTLSVRVTETEDEPPQIKHTSEYHNELFYSIWLEELDKLAKDLAEEIPRRLQKKLDDALLAQMVGSNSNIPHPDTIRTKHSPFREGTK